MAITSIKTGSSFTNLTKYNDFLAGNTAYSPAAYESIATVTVGSGGASSINFTSIPSTYQHLQIRYIGQTSRGTYANDALGMRMNSDGGNNYSFHIMRTSETSNSATVVQGFGTQDKINFDYGSIGASGGGGVYFGAGVIDILDYKNTNKYKTVRCLYGVDNNGTVSGVYPITGIASGAWLNTNAITSIELNTPATGASFTQYSKFGLFGIKGA
jgi:hypothetical protein